MRRSFALTILLNNIFRSRRHMCARAASCLEANTAALGDRPQTLDRLSSNPILGNVNDILKTKVDAGSCTLDVSSCQLRDSGKCDGPVTNDLTLDTTTGNISFDPNGVAGTIHQYCLFCKDSNSEEEKLKDQYYLLSDDPDTYSFGTECATLNSVKVLPSSLKS